MGDHSQDEHALRKIQHEWAEARVKGDSSYTRGIESDDCTIVWPDGSIVNKRQDLQTMIGDVVFTEFKIDDLQVRLYGNVGIRHRRGHHQSAQGKTRSSRRKIRVDRHICEAGRSMEDNRFTNHTGLGKIIAHS
jgi:ketosteroid isomerase-like protein